MAPVVVGLVTGQGQQPDQCQRARRHENRARPPHHHDANSAPTAGIDRAFGFEQAESAADDDHCRAQRQRGDDRDEYADRTGHRHGLEPRQPRELEAQHRAGDGQARTKHHVRGAVKHGVVRGFPVFAVSACLLVPTDQEDRIVGARGDRDERQEAGRERRQTHDARVSEERDDSPGGAEFDEHHQQDQDRRGDRAVDDQQHHRDDHERDERGPGRALVAGDALVGVHRRAPGDIGLHAWRRGCLLDDVAHGGDGLVGPRLAHVSAQIELHIGGLAVVALGARRGQRITPEVGDVLDMFWVGPERLDQVVVIVMRVGAERLVAFEDDHRVAVGVELLKVRADALHGDEGRRVMCVHRHGVGLAHLLQRGHEDVRDDGQGNPAQHDGHGEHANGVCDLRSLRGLQNSSSDYRPLTSAHKKPARYMLRIACHICSQSNCRLSIAEPAALTAFSQHVHRRSRRSAGRTCWDR